ncbi:MAG: DUF4349 domain-containing protein [Clostridia bacterium]|nr:DUF4349 domain-containing protein [Clostridia bacterium]
MKLRRTAKILSCLILVCVMISFTACGAAHNAADYAPNSSAKGESYYDAAMDADYGYTADDSYKYMEAPTTEAPSESASGTSQPTADSARKLIKNGTMDLETLTFESFMADLYNRIAAAGGYVQSSSENAGRYNSSYAYMRSAYVTARIPADRLDMFCSGVEGTCNVVSHRESTSDVTLDYYDTESHMRALQSEYETLVGILEKCTKLEDVISVQRRITDVLYQIESFKTTLNNYDNLVAYSTVTLNINEVKEPTIVTEQTLGERISTGFHATMMELREGAENFAVGFVANLPYILIWVIIIAVCVIFVRSCIRRARRKYAEKKKIPVPTDTENKEN